MRVCKRGWEYAQITDAQGGVEICSWATMNFKKQLGKLSESSMYDIWHGDVAKEWRKSLTDGSYRFCEKEKCPWMSNGTLEDHMEEYDDVLEYPTDLSISYDNTCNYRCKCCTGHSDWRQKVVIDENVQNKIDSELEIFMNNISSLNANGRGELFASKPILRILKNWKPVKPPKDIFITLESNGSLFNEKNWKQIEHLGKYHLFVAITVMSFEEDTYRFLSGTQLPVSQIVDNLYFISNLRKDGVIDELEIATVVQERNFRELPSFAKRCIEEFGVDSVRLRPYFPVCGGGLSEVEQWFYDVRNPYHPYYEEYRRVMNDPILSNKKVWVWSGEELSGVGAFPFAKDHENFEVIKYFATEGRMASKLTSYFVKKDISCVAVHGLSQIGQAFLRVMNETNIDVDKIIDKQLCGSESWGKTIISPADLPKDYKVPIIVTAPYYFDEIRKELQHQVDNPCIYDIKDIINEI